MPAESPKATVERSNNLAKYGRYAIVFNVSIPRLE
jgi:hypothetical protein